MTAHHPIADPDLQEFYDRAERDHDSDTFHNLSAPRGEQAGPRRFKPCPSGQEDRAASNRGRNDAAEPSRSLDAAWVPASTEPGADASLSDVRPRPSGLTTPTSRQRGAGDASLPAGAPCEEPDDFAALIGAAARLTRRAIGCPPARAGLGTAALAAEAQVLAGRLEALYRRAEDRL